MRLSYYLILLISLAIFATAAARANLLTNPDFDIDPSSPTSGWSAVGSGTLSHNTFIGDPAPPSARTDNNAGQSLTLQQCVRVVGGTPYDFSARSYTHTSSGQSINSVSVSFFSSADCTTGFLLNVPTDQGSFPNWYLREATDVVAPADANSARIELFADAADAMMNISWDNVVLDGLSPAVSPAVNFLLLDND